jgi:hypothetical protein
MKLFRCGILTGLFLSCCIMLPAKEFAARLNYRICVPDQPAAIEVKAADELAEEISMHGILPSMIPLQAAKILKRFE